MTNEPSDKLAAEQVFDYFLHELISGQSPPDLSQRITAAWSREQGGLTDPAGCSPAALAGAAGPATEPVIARPVRPPSAQYPLRDTPQLVIARPIHSAPAAHASSVDASSTGDPVTGDPVTGDPVAGEPVVSVPLSHRIPLRRQIVAALLATGACGLLTLLSWQLVDPDRVLTQRVLELARSEIRTLANPPLTAPVAADPDTTRAALPESPAASNDFQEPAATPQVAAADRPPTAAPSEEAIALFPLDRRSEASPSPQADSTQSGTSPRAIPATAAALDGRQIVAQIDQRLARVWQELAVTPSPKFNEAQRAVQVSVALTGLPPSGTADDLDAIISEATASLPFARLWADKFVGTWLAGTDLPADDARVQTLKQHFAEYIYNGHPWNTTALELLGGPLSMTSLGDAGQPPTISTQQSPPDAELNPVARAFVSALAGDGNHRLVSHIGTNFLNVDLSCARCHEVTSTSLAAGWANSDEDVERVEGRQAMYWSLTAMLQGIDTVTSDDGQRLVVDRQSKLLADSKPLTAYYDLIDGRLQAAEPRLPDGQAWETMAGADVPRQALAQWLSQSPAMDQATVNQVWRMIFGQPLVSHTSVGFNLLTPNLLSRELPSSDLLATAKSPMQSADQQQRELLLLLSTQYRAHGHDLKQLVTWIVRSDAFGRKPTRPTHTQWLAASQDQLRQWEIARERFASGVSPADPAITHSLETSLAMVLQWRERTNSGKQTALAQPVPSLAPATTLDGVPQAPDSNAASPADKGATGEVNDQLRPAPPTSEELAFVARLLSSQRLSWDDCVEHIVCLTPELLPDDRIHFLADELLRQHRGDAQTALLDLLWAVKRQPAQ